MNLHSRSSVHLLLVYLMFISSLILNAYLLITKHIPSGDMYKSTQKVISHNDMGVNVLGVIDGDTVVLDNKVRLRLRQIDAPELKFCGGKEAKVELEKLVIGKKVRIDEQIPDQMGRGMALMYVGNLLINEEILQSGWVRYHHDVTSKETQLKDAASYAKSKNLGIYGLCQAMENIENPSCNIKGNLDKSSKAKKYYLPDCAQYKFTRVEKDIGEDWFCNESDAQKAGFIKAETCSN
jgi:endonuclease YncB( thermonuclease family)